MAREFEGKVQFFGIAWHASKADSLDYVDRFDVPYPNGLDESEKIFRSYGFTYQPNTVLITKGGSVYVKEVGAVYENDLRRLLQELVAQP